MDKYKLEENDEQCRKDKIKLIAFYEQLAPSKKVKFMKLIDSLIPLLLPSNTK